jgi:two-component system nitrogen regulation sensor histidine kinase NtrY
MASPHNPSPDPPGADARAAHPGDRSPARIFGAPGLDPARDPLELPLAERRRRRRELWLAAFVVAAIAFGVLLERRVEVTQALPFGPGVPFFFLNALNVILIVLLVYLVARNFVKLVFERRRGMLGAHLNLKFVTAFILVATVPTAVLFFVSSSLVTVSIETWFSLQVDRALEQSREVAESYYAAASENALHYGEQIAEQIRRQRLLRPEEVSRLEAFLQQKQRQYNLGLIQVFHATDGGIVTLVNPENPAASFAAAESELVRSALHGVASAREEDAGGSDVIRGAVPIRSSDPARASEVVGALVVNYLIPVPVARKVSEIRAALDDYRRLQPSAGHISNVYQQELVLFSLVIVLFAVWWGFRMAKGVTGPIRALAEGTAEVARGNLDVVVETTSDDEVGFLVRSFNKMTHDLREARAGVERSNAELEQRRRYMEIVLRNIGAGVISVDAEGRIHTVNPSAQRLLGVPPGVGLIGHKVEEVLTRPEHVELVREFGRVLRPGVRESLRRQVQVPLGDEWLTLLVTVTLLQDDDGRSLGTVVVFDDYSQVVRAQRMEAWREVARRIAHEIKNPLTPIQLSAERIRRRLRGPLAGRPEDAAVLDECVGTIESQVEGLKLLVNEFSNFARLPAAKPRPDDLNRLVEEARASYTGVEDVVIQSDLDPRLPTVELDRDQIRRVLTNLIDNAIAAVREQRERDPASGAGRVELRTVHDAPLQAVRLEVADDGTGIAVEHRRRIFDPYFSTKDHGTGLGLAILSRIVADHGGYVRAHDNPPRGTRMIVELPAAGRP